MGAAVAEAYPPTMPCPICGGAGYHLFRTFHACACGIVFQDRANLQPAVYDSAYHRKYVNPRCEAAYLKAANLYMPLVGRLTRGRRMLEIGAAVDVTLVAFQKAGWDITGSDINTHIDSRVPMVAGNFEHVELDGPYDLIWASHVLEHFVEPVEALRKMFDLLSPRGVLLLATPDAGQLDFRQPQSWGHLHEKEHHVLFSLARFLKVAADQGFAPVCLRMNTSPAAGFIGWNDFHAVLVKQGHPVSNKPCPFPDWPGAPPMPELTRCRWEGVVYELLPYDVYDGSFWLRESQRRGLTLQSHSGGTGVVLTHIERRPFSFFRSPPPQTRAPMCDTGPKPETSCVSRRV